MKGLAHGPHEALCQTTMQELSDQLPDGIVWIGGRWGDNANQPRGPWPIGRFPAFARLTYKKISPIPATASNAPAQVISEGRCPVTIHRTGKISTGDSAESVETIPT